MNGTDRSHRRTLGAELRGAAIGARHVVRRLRHSPGISAAAILTCALATGIYASVIAVVDRIVLRPLPYYEPERLIQISSEARGREWRFEISPTDLADGPARLRALYSRPIREQVGAIASSAPALGSGTSFTLSGDTATVTLYSATFGLLGTLGVRPAAGRDFVEDDAAAPGTTVLISHNLWRDRFGLSNAVFEQTFQAASAGIGLGAERPYELRIVGVLPQGFIPPSPSVTGGFDGLMLFRESRGSPGPSAVSHPVIARLRPDVSMERAAAEITAVATGVWHHEPGLHSSGNEPDRLVVQPLQAGLFHRLKGFARLAMLAAALLVALTAANLAVLLIVHHRQRARETAVHAALGASGASLVLVPVFEALVLAGAGGLIGLALAATLNRYVMLGLPDHLRVLATPIADVRILAAALAIVVVAGLAAALPAAYYRRRLDVMTLVRGGARGRSPARSHWRVALLVAQMALTTTLVGGAVIAGRNYLAVATATGFDPDGLVEFSVQHGRGLPPADRVQRTLDVIRKDPAVRLAGASWPNPIGRFTYTQEEMFWNDRSEAGGTWGVTPGLLEAMGTPLRAGRYFSDGDFLSAAPVAILNERGARTLFPSVPLTQVVGRFIESRFGTRTIIGVVQDTKPLGGTAAIAGVYVAITDPLSIPTAVENFSVIVRYDGSSPNRARLLDALEAEFGKVSLLTTPTLPKARAALQAPTFLLMLLLALGIAATAVSATVVVVMTSMTAAMRQHEMAVRVALGARLRHVLALFARSEGGTYLAGLAIGLPMALWFGSLLQAFIVEAGAADRLTYVAAALLMLLAIAGAVTQSVLRFHRRLARSIHAELTESARM